MRSKLVIPVVILSLSLIGCSSGISQEQYESVVAERDEYKDELDLEQRKRKSEYAKLESQYNELESVYNQYKESMSEYEGLASAEAESRLIEAESIAESQRAYEESVAVAEEESRVAEEKLGFETGITYEQLARTPDDYKGKKVKFTGKVVQLIEGMGINQIRFAVNSDYDNMLYCNYSKNIVETRILEDDVITIYGTSDGLYTYQSTFGASITIPSVSIEKIDMVN